MAKCDLRYKPRFVIPTIELEAGDTYLPCDVMKTIGSSCVEWSPAIFILLVYLCSVLDEEPHHNQVVIQDSLQQREESLERDKVNSHPVSLWTQDAG